MGISLTYFIGEEACFGHQSLDWKMSDAEITLLKKNQNSQKLTFSYTYIANQKRYHSSRIQYLDSIFANDIKQNLFDKHAVGDTVTIFYDPERPKRAVLKRGFPLIKASLLIFFGILLSYIGGYQLIRKTKT